MVQKFQFSNVHAHLRDLWNWPFFLWNSKVYSDIPLKFKGKTKEIGRTFESHSKGTKNGKLWQFTGTNSKLCWGLWWLYNKIVIKTPNLNVFGPKYWTQDLFCLKTRTWILWQKICCIYLNLVLYRNQING